MGWERDRVRMDQEEDGTPVNRFEEFPELKAAMEGLKFDPNKPFNLPDLRGIEIHNRAIDAAAAQVTLGDTVTNTQRKILALKIGNPPDRAKSFAAEGKVCQFDNCNGDALDRITIDGVEKDYCCEHSDSIVKQKGLRWT